MPSALLRPPEVALHAREFKIPLFDGRKVVVPNKNIQIHAVSLLNIARTNQIVSVIPGGFRRIFTTEFAMEFRQISLTHR